jgi:hypothetical protein
MQNKLNEDMIVKLAAQFDTFPDLLRAATDLYVPDDESPSYYKGYVSAVLTVASLLNEQKVPINYDALVALAGKAAQLRRGMLEDEEDAGWLNQINAWAEASYRDDHQQTKH